MMNSEWVASSHVLCVSLSISLNIGMDEEPLVTRKIPEIHREVASEFAHGTFATSMLVGRTTLRTSK